MSHSSSQAPKGDAVLLAQRRQAVITKVSANRKRLMYSDVADRQKAVSIFTPIPSKHPTLPSQSQTSENGNSQPIISSIASYQTPFQTVSDAWNRLNVFHVFDTSVPPKEKSDKFMSDMGDFTRGLVVKQEHLQSELYKYIGKMAQAPILPEFKWLITKCSALEEKRKLDELKARLPQPVTHPPVDSSSRSSDVSKSDSKPSKADKHSEKKKSGKKRKSSIDSTNSSPQAKRKVKPSSPVANTSETSSAASTTTITQTPPITAPSRDKQSKESDSDSSSDSDSDDSSSSSSDSSSSDSDSSSGSARSSSSSSSGSSSSSDGNSSDSSNQNSDSD